MAPPHPEANRRSVAASGTDFTGQHPINGSLCRGGARTGDQHRSVDIVCQPDFRHSSHAVRMAHRESA